MYIYIEACLPFFFEHHPTRTITSEAMARLSSILVLTVFSLVSLGTTVPDPAGIALPPGTGMDDIGTIDIQLVDYSRPNPFAGDAETPGPRSFMIQLFYPAKHANKYPLAPYMPPATAAYHEVMFGLPNGTMSLIQTNSHQGPPMKHRRKTELILFSTGYGVSRQAYTTFAEDLASHGYLVAMIDHPYDAPIVEFPDGSVILADPEADMSDPEFFTKLQGIRVDDALFALQLLHYNLTSCIPGVRSRLRIDDTGMFGHSMGGATAAEVMWHDSRITGGINLDGQMGGEGLGSDLARPFLLMGTPDHNRTNDVTWATFWEHQSGWKRALVLADSKHLTYSDFSVLAEAFPGAGSAFTPEELAAMFGTINARRANLLQRVYILGFFQFALRGAEESLFGGPDVWYPEISFQN